MIEDKTAIFQDLLYLLVLQDEASRRHVVETGVHVLVLTVWFGL